MLFGYQDVLEAIKNIVIPLVEGVTNRTMHKEKNIKDYKAMYLIYQCVDTYNFEKVGDCKTSKIARKILVKSYALAAKENVVRLQTRKRQLELFQIE